MKLTYGVGLNDADYQVAPVVDGKQRMCPFFMKWRNMFKRCYSESEHKRRPNYSQCSVAEEWHSFMAFKRWMENQDWIGKHLDKDILSKDNKVYGPDTCVFVSQEVNSFTNENGRSRGSYPLGVHWCKRDNKFVSQVNYKGDKTRIGSFDCPNEAHLAWLRVKHIQACEIAETVNNASLAKALRTRYLKKGGLILSASEWARITDERDEAIYHLQELIGLARDCNLEEDEKFIEAEKFIDEYFDDE